MSYQYIALIRGINVGRAKRVAMADLRAHLLSNGLTDVTTLLNSGNVLFNHTGNAAKAEALIVKVLKDQMRVTAEVVVLSAQELRRIAKDNAVTKCCTDPSRLLITIFGQATDRVRFTHLEEKDWSPDQVITSEMAVYAWCEKGAQNSPLAKAVARAMGPRSTTRNWRTIKKLATLLDS